MKGIICYYSSTGNTKLACEYIAKNMKSINFDLVNIHHNLVDISSYDVVGFAATAEFWAPPYVVKTFIEQLPQQHHKIAFVFNTYGLFSGKTLPVLKEWVQDKGFRVIAGHSLRTPENYPPLITIGITSQNAPKPKVLQKFNKFISDLDELVASTSDKELKPAEFKLGLMDSLLPARLRTTARDDMGEKFVDHSLCNECGICKNVCPYKAIELDPKPNFNMDKCYGCWSCFNLCPAKAIYTRKIRGKGHYQSLKKLKEKLN